MSLPRAPSRGKIGRLPFGLSKSLRSRGLRANDSERTLLRTNTMNVRLKKAEEKRKISYSSGIDAIINLRMGNAKNRSTKLRILKQLESEYSNLALQTSGFAQDVLQDYKAKLAPFSAVERYSKLSIDAKNDLRIIQRRIESLKKPN